MIRVGVNGARGRMGRVACAAVSGADDMTLVAETDLGDDLDARIRDAGADVVIDFTVASSALSVLESILSAGAHAVVGTSGFGTGEVAAAADLCARHDKSALIAPNFAIASVLMASFAAQAAEHLPHVELIEAHSDKKPDAPSGTSLKIASDIARARGASPPAPGNESVPGVRGGTVEGVRVHSLRVPGLLARMECLFGGDGDTLTLRHDTLTRESFMPGVLLAVRNVQGLTGLTYGLEHIL